MSPEPSLPFITVQDPGSLGLKGDIGVAEEPMRGRHVFTAQILGCRKGRLFLVVTALGIGGRL